MRARMSLEGRTQGDPIAPNALIISIASTVESIARAHATVLPAPLRLEMMRLKPRGLGAGWQARHNRNPKHEGLAGTRARFNRLLSKAPGKKIQPRGLN